MKKLITGIIIYYLLFNLTIEIYTENELLKGLLKLPYRLKPVKLLSDLLKSKSEKEDKYPILAYFKIRLKIGE